MMGKARLAIGKVNVALDSRGYCFGAGRRQIPSSHLLLAEEFQGKANGVREEKWC